MRNENTGGWTGEREAWKRMVWYYVTMYVTM